MVWEETHVQDVVGSNPSAGYWMDIFHICCKNCIVFIKTEHQRKRGRDGPLLKKQRYARARSNKQNYTMLVKGYNTTKNTVERLYDVG